MPASASPSATVATMLASSRASEIDVRQDDVLEVRPGEHLAGVVTDRHAFDPDHQREPRLREGVQ